MADDNGRRRVVIGVLPDETASLVFADREGLPRAVMGLSKEKSVNLVFADAGGISRVGFGVESDGQGSVLLPSGAEGDDDPTGQPEG